MEEENHEDNSPVIIIKNPEKHTEVLDPRYLDQQYIKPGDGIDWRRPARPMVAPYRAFKDPTVEFSSHISKLQSMRIPYSKLMLQEGLDKDEDQRAGLKVSPFTITETTKFIDLKDEKETENTIKAYFKGTYGVASISASANIANNLKTKYHSVFSLLEHSGESERLDAESKNWSPTESKYVEEIIENEKNVEKGLRLFHARYGTHYVSSVKYGLRIGIQGKLNKKGSMSSNDFEAAFKASFGKFSAEAGVDTTHKNTLSKKDVELSLEVTSGGRIGPGLVTAQGFDDISSFLTKIGTGDIEFTVAPLELVLKSYWPTLSPKWEKIREALDPIKDDTVHYEEPTAIPYGTIIAWSPPPDAIKIDDTKPYITPPSGWALCNDTDDRTPDLHDCFIRGTADFKMIGKRGGNTRHTHKGSIGWEGKKILGHGESYQRPKAQLMIKQEDHLPPYYSLVYIMKVKPIED